MADETRAARLRPQQLVDIWLELAKKERADDWCNTKDKPLWQAIHRERAAIFDTCAAQLSACLTEAEPARPSLLVDRDADLRRELRVYLDTLSITGDNIGEIRRSLFLPWETSWNGLVRDETAEREKRAIPEPPQ